MVYVGQYEGWLCLIHDDTWNDEPVRDRAYYPIGNGYGEKVRVNTQNDWMLGKSARCVYHDSVYVIDPDTGYRKPFEFTLQHGGKTTPIHYEKENVDPPPSRGKELRWYRGRWERLLKKGWTLCETK